MVIIHDFGVNREAKIESVLDALASTESVGRYGGPKGAVKQRTAVHARANAKLPQGKMHNGSDLLRALWRDPTQTHQLTGAKKGGKDFRNVPVESAEDGHRLAQAWASQRIEAYFACAEFNTQKSRLATNVSGVWAFVIDIDCSLIKAAAGKGYVNQDEAYIALMEFCGAAGLPLPTHIVNSGGGLHVYWAFDKVLGREIWLRFAKQLKALALKLGFLADPTRTADPASILRVPGTFNFKYDPPRPVELIYSIDVYIEQSVMLASIETAHRQHCPQVEMSAAAVVSKSEPAGLGAMFLNAQHGYLDLGRLRAALKRLDPDCDEPTWALRRIAPLARTARSDPELRSQLYALARSWSSGELRGVASKAWNTRGGNGQTGKAYFEIVWKRFLKETPQPGCVTLGTIFHDAKAAGWDGLAEQFPAIADAVGEDL